VSEYSQDDDVGQRSAWSDAEIRATVEDYFQMLRLELLGQKYNKSAHRESLLKVLSGRSGGAVELKHRNISAVLLELGVMPIRGYKPLSHYQNRLYEIVADCVESDQALDEAALKAVDRAAEYPLGIDLNTIVVPPPVVVINAVREPRLPWNQRPQIHRDYLERESRNRALGSAGENLVMEFEARRLHSLGMGNIANKIEQISKTKGDACGFDILSFEASGKERFIEVKTTAYTAETPFFLSKGEVDFSAESHDQYWLYRVFNFRDSPKMFHLNGSVSNTCRLDPASYRAVPL
jgi:hypothetical protein